MALLENLSLAKRTMKKIFLVFFCPTERGNGLRRPLGEKRRLTELNGGVVGERNREIETDVDERGGE